MRYVPKSASAVFEEQEAAKQAEYEYFYEEYEEPGSGDERQCRVCESGMPRFFFADTQEEDMNDLPCCPEHNSTRPVTRTRR